MRKEKDFWLLIVLFLVSPLAWGTPLDLQYKPGLDSASTPAVVSPPARQVAPQSVPPQQGATKGAGGYGWQWLSPRLTTARPGGWETRYQAARIAQKAIDQQLLQERRNPLLNDLPPALQSVPLTLDVGVKYQF